MNFTMRRLTMVLLALLLGAGAVLAQGESASGPVAEFLARQLSGPGRTVRLFGLQGILTANPRLERVVVEDGQGAWLTAHDVSLTWRPGALIRGRFEAEELLVGRIEFMRLPQSADGSGNGGVPSLPLDVSVERIRLPEIVLGEAIAGGVAALAAEGAFRASGNPLDITAKLSAQRTDGRDGHLDLRLEFAPEENRFDLRLAAEEADGAIISRLLGLRSGASVLLAAEGSGLLSDWQGQARLMVDGEMLTEFSADHQLVGDRREIALNGQGSFVPFLPEGLKALARGQTRFVGRIALMPEGGLEVSEAEFRSDSLMARAAGRVVRGGLSDLTVQLDAREGSVPLSFAGAAMELQSGRLTLAGEGMTPALDGEARLAGLSLGGYGLAPVRMTVASPGFDLSSFTGPVSLVAEAERAKVPNALLEPVLAGPLRLESEAAVGRERIEVTRASLTGAKISAGAAGQVFPGTGAFKLDLQARVAADVLPREWQMPLGETATISGSLSRAADGALDVSGLRLSSGPLSAEGTASFLEDQLGLAVSGRYERLAQLSPAVEGTADFTLRAEGPLGAPAVALSLSAEEIRSVGRTISDLTLDAEGVLDVREPAATVSLAANIDGETLQASGQLTVIDGVRKIEDLLLVLGENRIEGSLSLDEDFRPLGSIRFDLPEMGPLAALGGQKLTGAASGTASFTRPDGIARLALDAEIASLARDSITASDVKLDIEVADYLGSPVMTGRIEAERIDAGARITALSVALGSEDDWTGFDGIARINDVPARLQGRLRPIDKGAVVELAAGEATVRGLNLALGRDSTLMIEDGKVRTNGLVLTVAGGQALVSGSISEMLDLEVQLNAVGASAINAFTPGLAAEGTLSGTVRATGPIGNPRIAYDVGWANAATAQSRGAGFGALSLDLQGLYASGRATVEASASGADGLRLGGDGTVSTTSRTLALAFSGQVPFDFLARRLAERGMALAGTASVSLNVTGSFADPDISGSVSAASARFVDVRSGIAIEDISADIALGGGVATVRSMTGRLSAGGTISASGTIGLDGGFPADLSVVITDGRYVDGSLVTANFSGNLSVTGPLVAAPLLSGTINLDRAVITVPERLPGSLSQLNVEHRNAPPEVRRQAEALRPAQASGSAGGLTFDLTISAPQQIFVRGRGLDAELGGSLQLTGPAASPQAIGTFTLRRGRLAILGRRLDFSRGTLGFAGSLVPRLDLAATSRAGTTDVTVTVSGPADDPSISFSSSPVLPQEEIAAQLIFGRSLNDLSPLQIAQLAEAVAQLTGVGGPTSLLDRLRSALGVDDLDIRTDEETGGTTLAIGKYLNERTYLGLEKGTEPGSGRAVIDLEVGQGVKLRGEAREDGRTRAGIFFEREY